MSLEFVGLIFIVKCLSKAACAQSLLPGIISNDLVGQSKAHSFENQTDKVRGSVSTDFP